MNAPPRRRRVPPFAAAIGFVLVIALGAVALVAGPPPRSQGARGG
jgi:hypothetical protein